MSEVSVKDDVSLEALVGQVADEFLRRQAAGEHPDIEEYTARHPEAAEVLRKVLASLQLFDASRSVTGEARTLAGEDGPAGTLGDFRLIREVGRGGMGIVYEAEQISLGRRVALKVLPFAATMDPRHLQRFHNEARAAAGLHHTNIVPVYAVGCERGVHFYAMQFIEGQTLAAMIAEVYQRGGQTPPPADQPTTPHVPGAPAADTAERAAAPTERSRLDTAYFRRVAEWGIQAAEALDHAHQMGVVHRDVKPANLLVDATGRLWVTDFGLAQMQSDVRVTRTGDLIGTLRYMSPEQALAKRVVIDHRTDVYSLGATLYELLTLQPAYGGNDRQELLRQIAFEEPTPPRRLNKRIPPEPETIVLKALEKNPADRYATAKELADDLRHWLEDRPIRARRPSLRQRVAKWARRHRGLVWAVSLVLLAAALVGGTGGVWWVQQRAAAETEAERALKDADDLQQAGDVPGALAAVQRAGPLHRSGLLPEPLRRRMQDREEDLAMAARLEDIRLQEAALVSDGHFDHTGADSAYGTAFRDFGIDVTILGAEEAAERIRARSIRLELAAALERWALRSKAPGWRNLLRIARLADPDVRRNRLRAAMEAGDPKAAVELVTGGQTGEWSKESLEVLAIACPPASKERVTAVLQRAQQRQPGDFWINELLGWFLVAESRPSCLDEAIRFFSVGVALRPRSAGAHFNLGSALQKKGRTGEAIAEYRVAIRLKNDYAEAHDGLGQALAETGRRDDAIAEFREAVRLAKGSAWAYNDLGVALLETGRLDEAIVEFREACRRDKDSANTHYYLGRALHKKGRLDDAIAECREAIRLKKDFAEAHSVLASVLNDKGRLDEAIAEYQAAIRLKEDFPEAHYNLGGVLLAKGRLDEAIAQYRAAIRFRKDYPDAHCNLGTALYANGRPDEAIAEYREAIRIQGDHLRAHYDLAVVLQQKGRLDEAIAEYRAAIELRKDYPEAHCNLGHALVRKGQFRQAVEQFRLGHALGSRLPGWDYPSARWLRNAERLADLDARLPKLLAGEDRAAGADECLALAQLCQSNKGLYAAAARWFGEAFDARPALAEEPSSGNRYNAACAAALAGCGQGTDADKLGAKERAGLRQQARDWLQADLKAYRRLMEKSAGKARPEIAQRMQHWLQDEDFARVRGAEALAKLPEAEREAWRKLWADVAETLARADSVKHPPKK